MPAERWQQWMPFHIDRFRGSLHVQGMPGCARAGYLYLLASAWQSADCSLPNDNVELQILSGLTLKEWTQYKPIILRRFTVVNDSLVNDVLRTEWNEARKVYEKRKTGAERANRSRSANAVRTHSERPANTVTGTGTGTIETPKVPTEPSPTASQPDPPKKTPEELAGEERIAEERRKSAERSAGIERVFSYYCRKLKRDPQRYTLTDARRKKARSRLMEREQLSNLDTALEEAKQCVDNLAASEHHVQGGYIDWTEQIFRSAEEFEKRLNWQKPTGVNNGKSEFKSKTDRTLDALRASLAGDNQDRIDPAGPVAQSRVIEGGTGLVRNGAGELGDGRPPGGPEILVAAPQRW